MKIHLLLVLLLAPLPSFSQQMFNLSLDQIGKFSYRKELDSDRGLIVYRGTEHLFAQIVPREYYMDGRAKDTIVLTILREEGNKHQPYRVECNGCGEVTFKHTIVDSLNYFEFCFRDIVTRFQISFERHPTRMVSSGLLPTIEKDSTIGYIRLRNTFIHYATIPTNPAINIALMDMDFNGRMDENDFIGISKDEFFHSVKNSHSAAIKDVRNIAVDGMVYQLDASGKNDLKLSLKPVTEKGIIPDLWMKETLDDITLGDRKLYEMLEEKDYVLISYWSDYCLPCIKNIPSLNNLPPHVEIVGLFEGGQDLKKLEAEHSIKYYNIECSKEMKQQLNLNGFPYYILIDKNKTIVLNTRDLEDVLKFI